MILRKYFLSCMICCQIQLAPDLWASTAVMSDCFTYEITSMKSGNAFSNSMHARTFSITSAMMTWSRGRWLVNMILFEFSVKMKSVSTGHVNGGGGSVVMLAKVVEATFVPVPMAAF